MASMQTSAPKPPVTDLTNSTGSVARGVAGVGGAELLGPRQLAVVDVDADDRRGAGQRGTGDRRVADPAAAEHGDRLAAADAAGVHRRAEPGHDAAAEQPGGRRRGRRIDLGALPGGDERLLGEGTDAEGGRQLGAVLQRHLLRRVVGVEAVPGLAAAAGAALAADRPPVEDDVVARGEVGDVIADGLDDAGRLVTEEERELIVDPALAVVQVGVAHPAGLDLHHGLSGAGIGDDDGLDAHRLALGPGHDAAYVL